jgi:hypothetical protein
MSPEMQMPQKAVAELSSELSQPNCTERNNQTLTANDMPPQNIPANG